MIKGPSKVSIRFTTADFVVKTNLNTMKWLTEHHCGLRFTSDDCREKKKLLEERAR